MHGNRGRAGAGAAVLGALMAAVGAAPAAAGTDYAGATDQGRRVALRLSSDRSRIEYGRIAWEADCNRRGYVFRTVTRLRDEPLVREGAGFAYRGAYRFRGRDGVTARVAVRLHIEVVDDATIDGTWRARVRVRKAGSPIDRCRTGALPFTARA